MLKKIIDRLLFHLFYKRYYKKIFQSYGENVRWGKHFERLVIPSSVRISCPDKISIGHDCKIDEGVYLQCHNDGDGIIIGDGSRINAHTHILAYSLIHLKESVLIAPFSLISSGNHGHRSSLPIMDQPHTPSGPITIGSGTWIGHSGKVLGGVLLGKNTVVGTGALVTKSFTKDGLTLVGVPAREV